MRNISIVIVILLCSLLANSQTFTWNGYAPILDLSTDTIPIQVSGLATTINSSFGISKICFDISHSYKSNLIISLVSPDGHTVILAENQGGSNNLFTGTCVALDGVPFALGTPPFTGTFLPTGDISTFNNGQDPNGTWRLLVRDNVVADTGSVHSASITFINNPPQGQGVGNAGNLGPQGPFIKAGLVCPGGASGCDLLPDVTASAYEILMQHTETPGMITVSNGTPNIGYGPLEIFAIDSCFCNGAPAPCNVACPNNGELQRIIRQRIYRKMPGTDTLGFFDRDAGAMTFHPEHGHLHVDNWANITLRSATSDPDPRNWPIIGTSVKQSYCLINLGSCAGKPGECVDNNGGTILTVPNNNFGFQTGCGFNQGIYPGQYDVYSESLNEPILLDHVCNGNYYIVSITDPDNHFLESDKSNNWVAVPITLTQQSGVPAITASSQYLCSAHDSLVLTASFAPDYNWSTAETTRSITVKTPGTYTVATSCSGTSASFTVAALPQGAAAAVSIAVTAGSIPACPGTVINFKATSAYGGNTPAYQWKVNGVNVGANSDTYTMIASANGQKVSCVFTSSIDCFSPVTSDSITVFTNPADSFDAVVTQTKGYNPFCPGDTVTFTAAALPGINPVYHWKVDGGDTGSNSPEFTSSSLQDGQVISCTINAIPLCGQNATVGIPAGYNTFQTTSAAAYPTWYGNGRQQYLIHADELLASGVVPGSITNIGFITGSNIGDPAILKGYTIKLAAVTQTGLTGTMLSPAFTTVYGPADYAPVLNDTNFHNFTTPFLWDGVSNLLVDICFNSGVYGRGSYLNLTTNTAFVSGTIYQADNYIPNACDTTRGSRSISQRPLMIFANTKAKDKNSNEISMEKLEPVYHFTGNGNWNIAANWENSKIPPKHVLHCAEIIIDPAPGGECILNTSQVVAPGAKITVVAGKKFRVTGNVLVQE